MTRVRAWEEPPPWGLGLRSATRARQSADLSSPDGPPDVDLKGVAKWYGFVQAVPDPDIPRQFNLHQGARRWTLDHATLDERRPPGDAVPSGPSGPPGSPGPSRPWQLSPVAGRGVTNRCQGLLPSNGGLEGILRIDERPAVLEEEDVEVAIRPFLQGSFEEDVVRGWFSQMGIRERGPAFRALRVDPLGWTWAELWRSGESEPGAWAVFDPSGQAHGTLSLPRDFVLHDIGADFVLGAFTDSLGVPYVRRYPLRRSPGVPRGMAAETAGR